LPSRRDYVLELAAKWRTRDIESRFLGLDISMDVLFDDGTHMLDQSLTALAGEADAQARRRLDARLSPIAARSQRVASRAEICDCVYFV
jgi:hypothetical protein